jgi:hypothetical protein
MIGFWVGWLRNQSSIPSSSRGFSTFTAYWLVQGIIQPPVQWVRTALSSGWKDHGMKLTLDICGLHIYVFSKNVLEHFYVLLDGLVDWIAILFSYAGVLSCRVIYSGNQLCSHVCTLCQSLSNIVPHLVYFLLHICTGQVM